MNESKKRNIDARAKLPLDKQKVKIKLSGSNALQTEGLPNKKKKKKRTAIIIIIKKEGRHINSVLLLFFFWSFTVTHSERKLKRKQQ